MVDLSPAEIEAAGAFLAWFAAFGEPPARVCSLNAPAPDGVHFTVDGKNLDAIPSGAYLLAPEGVEVPGTLRVARVSAPKYEVALLMRLVAGMRRAGRRFEMAGGAHVAVGAGLPDDLVLSPGAVVEGGAVLGRECVVESGAVIRGGVSLGDRCHVHANAVVGADGFGYAWPGEGGEAVQIPHLGGVSVGDDVVVGPGAVVAAGTFDPTVLGHGCKLDGLTYVGHNARLGRRVMVCAGAVVGGSTMVGDEAWVATGVSTRHKLSIGGGTTLGVGSVVMRDVGDGATVMGDHARELRTRMRREAALDAVIREYRKRPRNK